MVVEIINVGTEILLGNIVNTNACFLAKKCADLGLNLYHHQVVGDNLQRLVDTLKLASSRSDIIILSGGLGPTLDDMTREGLSSFLEMPLILNDEIKDKLEGFFNSRNIKMTENNLRQAMVIKDAIVIENHNGTAPGMIVEKDSKIYILLPGPPFELEPMFCDIEKYIRARFSGLIYSRTLKLCNISESVLETRMMDLLESKNPTVAIYAKIAAIDIRISAMADNREGAIKLIAPVEAELKKRFEKNIFSDDENATIESTVLDLLRKKGQTLAVAESCTGGLLSSNIVENPHASDVFKMGVVTYSNESKSELLGVPKMVILRHGAVSSNTAEAMCVGLFEKYKADANIAITGVSGPDHSENKPVGLVYIACSYEGRINIVEHRFKGNRNIVRNRAAKFAITLLRDMIVGIK